MRRFALAVLIAAPALASPGPQPVPLPLPPPVALDVAYPGTIAVAVDARDVTHRIVRVRETMPVVPGPLVLLYPQWVQGAHQPLNTVDHLAGLAIRANGRLLDWDRDTVATHAFHVIVPPGARSLDITFDLVTPTDAKQGRITITDDVAHLQWQSLILYPAGVFSRRIMVEPSLTLPQDWRMGTALDTGSGDGAITRFKPVDLETLLDSPILAGRNFRRIVIDNGAHPVRLDIAADMADAVAATPAQLALYGAMTAQADLLFGGSRPFDHYDVLLALSDTIGGVGREHHRSTEIATRGAFFTEWDRGVAARATIPHEYVHSWNGKYRQGADSWTADANTPIRNSLLWVYEGQTQYWGNVLAARAGLVTAGEARDALALSAAGLAATPGRAWRPLADTVDDPLTASRRPQPWASWQRGMDYYGEGALIWLDADTLIREGSGGKRSLDDFARTFFGGSDGVATTHTYMFEDVVAALNNVWPHDWAAFLNARLRARDRAPLDGLARGGYRLAWAETPTAYQRSADALAKRTDLSWSLGLTVDNKDGTLGAVQWDGPAFKAGLTVGTQLIAVGGAPWTPDLLLAAVTAAKDTQMPVTLIVKAADRLGTVAIDWHGGLRYPRLEAIPGAPPRLDDILAPRR